MKNCIVIFLTILPSPTSRPPTEEFSSNLLQHTSLEVSSNPEDLNLLVQVY